MTTAFERKYGHQNERGIKRTFTCGYKSAVQAEYTKYGKANGKLKGRAKIRAPVLF